MSEILDIITENEGVYPDQSLEHPPLAESTSCSSVNNSSAVDETETDSEESDVLTDTEYDIALIEARRQWEESLVQLNQVVNWVLLPLLGKFLGRKAAMWTWKWAAGKLYQ